MSLSHKLIGPKLSSKIKLKSIPSPEQNQFVHIAMRYPVLKNFSLLLNSSIVVEFEIFSSLLV